MVGVSLFGGAAVARAGAAMAAENRACAARHAAAYELYEECIRHWASRNDSAAGADFARVDPWRAACTHLVEAFVIADRRAGRLLDRAVEFTERIPAALSAMADGLMDERTATIIAEQTCTVDAEKIGAVQARVVAEYLESTVHGMRYSAAGLRRAVDEVIADIDPDGLAARTKKAVRERHVLVRKAPNGMADLTARLTSAEATAIAESIDQHPAAQPADTDDPRDIGERRADALCAMTLQRWRSTHDSSSGGGSSGGGGRSGEESQDAAPPVLRPQITLISDSADSPLDVFFDKAGTASIEALIALLARSDRATVRQVDPEAGAADSLADSTRYRPGADMDRRIRLRDGTCRHPGCSIPAKLCDIDHVVPFDHDEPNSGGPTQESNLMCLCRAHHRLKTFTGWHYTLLAGGLLRINTDTDHYLFTTPSGPLAHARNRKQKHRTPGQNSEEPPPF